MPFALIEHDRRVGLDLVKEIAAAPHGATTLKWVDISKTPEVQVGWVYAADDTFAPYVLPIDEARRIKLAELDGLCRTDIVGGFDSSALGAPHRYGSAETDQANLDRAATIAGSAADGWTAKVKCTPAGGTASFLAHDAAQLRTAVADLHASIEGYRLKLDGLKAKVAAAATTAAVQAVAWG